MERSDRTDKQEFYQLLMYTGDVDLNEKLVEWENFYNYQGPHGAFQRRSRRGSPGPEMTDNVGVYPGFPKTFC